MRVDLAQAPEVLVTRFEGLLFRRLGEFWETKFSTTSPEGISLYSRMLRTRRRDSRHSRSRVSATPGSMLIV